jgi:acyl-CoA synthetase (AMP-forming)/AMP-acid ligase II
MSGLIADLARLTSHQPDKVAMLDANARQLTYREMVDQIEQAQGWLHAQGLRPGDALVALMPNAIETVVLFLASMRGGYTYAPLPCTATRAEVARWKDLTRARVCIVATAVSTSFQQQIRGMDWRTVMLDVGGDLVWPAGARVDAASVGRLALASSGSTGEPKAMLLDGDRLWASGQAFLRYHDVSTADMRFWNYLPMSYLGGLFNLSLIPLAAGGSIFVDEGFSGKTFLTFWPTVERFHINALWLVPTIMRGLLALADRVGHAARPEIRYCYLGTAPVSLDDKRRFTQVFGIQPLENFGLSETTFISSERARDLALRREGTVGGVMPDVEVRFVPVLEDEPDATEICVRTPYVMLGYLDANGVLDASVDAEGFFRTGDVGRLVDGQLQLTGRRRDIIKKGGLMVGLREIEIVAEAFPDVLEAAAVRIPHDFYGESCVLYVRTRATAAERDAFVGRLSAWLHEQLVRYKWPERIVHRDDFPRTASGKIRKQAMTG